MADQPAARRYRVEPNSELLTAVDYIRAQADFTIGWIDSDAARALNPADVAVSKDMAAASLEVLADLDRYRKALARIASHSKDVGAQDCARRALEGEGDV